MSGGRSGQAFPIRRRAQDCVGKSGERRRPREVRSRCGSLGLAGHRRAAFFWQQRAQAKPKLTDQDVLVVADFDNKTGDPVFDTALKQALAFQLQQSPFLKAMDEAGSPADHEAVGPVARCACHRRDRARHLHPGGPESHARRFHRGARLPVFDFAPGGELSNRRDLRPRGDGGDRQRARCGRTRPWRQIRCAPNSENRSARYKARTARINKRSPPALWKPFRRSIWVTRSGRGRGTGKRSSRFTGTPPSSIQTSRSPSQFLVAQWLMQATRHGERSNREGLCAKRSRQRA